MPFATLFTKHQCFRFSVGIFCLVLSTLVFGDSESEAIEDSSPCSSIESCQTEATMIQAEIVNLEENGVENLTGDEFEKYVSLTDKLMVLHKQHSELLKLAIESTSQHQEDIQKLIRGENLKQNAMRHSQEKEIEAVKDILMKDEESE